MESAAAAATPQANIDTASAGAAPAEQSGAPSVPAYFESHDAVRRFLAEESEHERKVRPTQPSLLIAVRRHECEHTALCVCAAGKAKAAGIFTSLAQPASAVRLVAGIIAHTFVVLVAIRGKHFLTAVMSARCISILQCMLSVLSLELLSAGCAVSVSEACARGFNSAVP